MGKRRRLPDPDRCPRCHRPGRVLDSRLRVGYRRRRHRCAPCKVYWVSYQTIIHPDDQLDSFIQTIY